MLSPSLTKLQGMTLRGYMMIIIICDLAYLALSFYGQYGLYTLSTRGKIYKHIFLAELGLIGVIAITNMIAVPAVITNERQRAKSWRMLLLPHVVSNMFMIILQLGFCFFLAAISEYKGYWYLFVGSFFPGVAWNCIAATVTYSYFRNVSLHNVVQDGTDDEKEKEIKSVEMHVSDGMLCNICS